MGFNFVPMGVYGGVMGVMGFNFVHMGGDGGVMGLCEVVWGLTL